MKKQVLSVVFAMSFAALAAEAQVPADIEQQLVKMGHIVDPPCTAKLYRPLMPANDISSTATPHSDPIQKTSWISFWRTRVPSRGRF